MLPADLSALRYRTRLDQSERNQLFLSWATQGRRVLELGCADGFISQYLVERGCSVTGIEIDVEAAKRARQWCDQVLTCDLNLPTWTEMVGDDFDTVLCGDVLEHLADPWTVLRQISKVLAKNGRIVISLPNVANLRVRLMLLGGKFRYEEHGILDITHLRFFTLKTARELIEQSGYRIVFSSPIVGGGITRPIRSLFPGLFAVQMLFVASPV
jgi:O-antigen biosynthesis protein